MSEPAASSMAMKRLLALLGSIAAYNDKGWQWSGHDAAHSEALRAGWSLEIRDLLDTIETDALPAPLRQELLTRAPVQDGDGVYVEKLKRWIV
ncbi:hypothetical protein [Lysobacter capsici]|uniref:hypothetical protein n=1 Tax=Lysobacter capsici TaxID=435897 RepID=UPI001C00505C|nr:hypothetical protein [Lysobacter capsici]QWF18567.1 hypothetical protein KME82_07405 [Lysobacter capsici]